VALKRSMQRVVQVRGNLPESPMPRPITAAPSDFLPKTTLPSSATARLPAGSHSNCDIFPTTRERLPPGFIGHHQAHHSHYDDSFGFFSSRLRSPSST